MLQLQTPRARYSGTFKRRSLAYWLPLLIPFLICLFLPMLRFQSVLMENETLRRTSTDNWNEKRTVLGGQLAQLSMVTARLPDEERWQVQVIAENANALIESELDTRGSFVLANSDGTLTLADDMVDEQVQLNVDAEYDVAVSAGLKTLLTFACSIVVMSMITVDIWALTVLLTMATRARLVESYAYPLVALFVHLILLVFAVSLDNSVSDLGVVLAVMITSFSLLIAWRVRELIWVHHDGLVKTALAQ